MFTGLVEEVGKLRRREARRGGARVTIACSMAPLSLGESIAVNGACLTVARIATGRSAGFEADLSAETLARTTLGKLRVGGGVHLERATPFGGRMGGHAVLGHVDGIGRVLERTPVGEGLRVVLLTPPDLGRYVAEKGSIAVDGVSLTINGVADGPDGTAFDVMLVPHTLDKTFLGSLAPGARVNLEVDVLARYVARQIAWERTTGSAADRDAALLSKLRDGGWLED